MIKLLNILKEEQSYNLVKNEGGEEYVDIEMYKDILIKVLAEKGIELDRKKWEIFEDDFMDAEPDAYKSITPSGIINDYFTYVNNI